MTGKKPNRIIWLIWCKDSNGEPWLVELCQTRRAADAWKAYLSAEYGAENVWCYGQTPVSDPPNVTAHREKAVTATQPNEKVC